MSLKMSESEWRNAYLQEGSVLQLTYTKRKGPLPSHTHGYTEWIKNRECKNSKKTCQKYSAQKAWLISSVKEKCVWFPGVLIVFFKFMIVVFIKHEHKWSIKCL